MHQEHIGGLHELWLKNGYEEAGGSIRYRDPEGLVRAIAVELCRSPHRLAPDGVHFLRCLLEHSPEELDALLGLPAGSVAACEEGTEILPPEASLELRTAALAAAGSASRSLPEQTLAHAKKMVFAHDDVGWYCAERVILPALLSAPPA